MALSCHSNCQELEAQLNSEMSIFGQPLTELPPELFGFDSRLTPLDSYNDPFLESQEVLYRNYCHSLLPSVSSPPESLYSLVLAQERKPSPYMKRQKVYEESFNSEIILPGFCNGFAVSGQSLFQELSPEIHGPFPDFASKTPAEAPKKHSGGSLSAQSIAARQRRRKITEKTQELGMLIPGGQKMNTAEMFQAAFKYIKFLQAQVGVLETMASVHQESGVSFENDNEEMGPLIESSLIQEKLYAVLEKCVVPKRLIESLGNHHKLQLGVDNSSLDTNKLL